MKTDTVLPTATNLAFVEALYAEYLRHPTTVPAEWQEYFAKLGDGEPPKALLPTLRRRSIFNPLGEPVHGAGPEETMVLLQHRVDRMIRAFRVRGHLRARIDPLNNTVPYVPELDPRYYDFSEADLDKRFVCELMHPGGRLSLREIISRLRRIYCGSIGIQYLHIDNIERRHWVQERIEGESYWKPLPRAQQLRIFTRLTDALVFEQFIQRKYVGAKSFSLEGGESLIPLLDLAIERASEHGVTEIVIGMAHRGRLNVLANIIGKSPKEIFREFEDKDPDLYLGGGDVKYHLGYSNDYHTAAGGVVHLSVCFNPSHLEFINPVLLGRVRAKQDHLQDHDHSRVMGLMIHGDAAFIGEGVVQETLNLSRLPGYSVGGTVHILINNQIGFTTPPSEGRSSMYATSVAKMLPAPILHVNGEDPEAVARCIQLAMDFRHTFKQDIVIDMYCYRRRGHNEGDEPSFTQPLLYARIEQRPSIRDGYLEHLLKLGGVTRAEADEIAQKRQELLEQQFAKARSSYRPSPPRSLEGIWEGFRGGPEPRDDNPTTGVPQERLSALLAKLAQVPADFCLHPKLRRFMKQRRLMAQGAQPLDWSTGEALALASLAAAGHRLRISGQDSARGTFSQRHAILHDVQSGRSYVSLQHVADAQGPVEIYNSPLSETGVLGFEYGYSLDAPAALVMWEAQFGDFVNAAQVIVDQFIVSGEEKWRRLSGLVLLLPHGFEGAGPEHSSARLERFLSLAAEDNIQIVVPTTPAQYFHVLRRQVMRSWRKPLVVFTPKSMLRQPRAVSPLAECARGQFRRVLPDPRGIRMNLASRVLLCSGKIYYELEAEREKLGREDLAIIRLEQLYPFPRAELEELLAECQPGANVIWVQEEPENMGAWHYLRITARRAFLDRLPFTGVCRPASASPATGSAAAHRLEQSELLKLVFAAEPSGPRPRTDTILGVKQATLPA